MESFGRYQLLERIGRGGMAEVFAAETSNLDGFRKQLVIKRIRPELSSDEHFVSMFIDEARISISLAHPNVVQVFDFGQAEGCYYLAMEHVQGVDLRSVLELKSIQGQGIEPGLALYILVEALKGVDYAHNLVDRDGEPLNMVHRDLSPHNIMVSRNGAVKVTDFGVAKARGRVTQTRPGVVVGKYTYMSPEQVRAEQVDRRTDVYSCGVVLWELLVGRTRHNVYGNDSDLLTKVRQGALDPPGKLNRSIEKPLSDIVMRATAPERDERYQTAREFSRALHAYLVANYPDIDSYSLEAFLDAHEQELAAAGSIIGTQRLRAQGVQNMHKTAASTDTVPCNTRRLASTRSRDTSEPSNPSGAAQNTDIEWTEEQTAIIEEFRRTPSLWRLLRLGDSLRDQGQDAAALTTYRVTAGKFAQQGLLAQCLLSAHRMLAVSREETVKQSVAGFVSLPGKSEQAVSARLFQGEGRVECFLRDLLSDPSQPLSRKLRGTPLLSYIEGSAFASLAEAAPLRRFQHGDTIVKEGDTGRSMFLVGAGRVLVYLHGPSGERVYLSSLTAGDFFGENGFFTGAPRSATVMALGSVELIEVDPDLYSRVLGDNEQARNTLMRFYKERIVEAILAKSPVFGLLSVEERQMLTGKFELVTYDDGSHIITEGEQSDQIYVVKHGQAQVETDKDGERVILSVIGPGTVFGEVGALRGIPRTATVKARGILEALVLECSELRRIVDARPDLGTRLQEVINHRVRENLGLLVGFSATLKPSAHL